LAPQESGVPRNSVDDPFIGGYYLAVFLGLSRPEEPPVPRKAKNTFELPDGRKVMGSLQERGEVWRILFSRS
jgi:hypothetical protein